MGGNIKIGYNTVEDVEAKVYKISDEVETILKRVDDIVSENVGKGTDFMGKTADEMASSWAAVRSSFANYKQRILDICHSAQFANREYNTLEEDGITQIPHLEP